jgi:branched-chain amino acid transport system substrate-binding protein
VTIVINLQGGETKMKKSRVWRASALIVGLSLVGVACGGSDDASSAESCDGALKIAFFGALTGDAGNLGQNIKKGLDLAVAEYNAENADNQITVEAYDSQGDPDQAPALADKAISDGCVKGIVGPAFSGESKAVNGKFEEAGLPLVTPSATNPDLSKNGWTVFHRALAGDDKQGPGIVSKIVADGKTKVGVVDDNSEYGKGLADIVRSGLGDKLVDLKSLDPESSDYSAVITQAKSAGVDAVFFGGYYAAAGKLAKQMKDAGVTAQAYFPDGVLDKGFIEAGGPAAEGAIITCTCAPFDSNADFLKSFRDQFKGEDPATYAAEAYDAATAFLDAIKDGKTTRGDINKFLDSYDKAGVTKQLKWDAAGEVSGSAVYAYTITGGKIDGTLGLIK